MRRVIYFLLNFLIAFILFCYTGLFAQQISTKHIPDTSISLSSSIENLCSNDMILAELRKDPGYKAKEEKMNRDILNYQRMLTPDTLILPVVIHIINNNPYIIPDAQIINGINNLNDAFSKSGAYSASLGADTKIRFCIAQKAPDGGLTTGITRTQSFFSSQMNSDIEDGKLKNLIQWDPARYINIWFISSANKEWYAVFRCGTWTRLSGSSYATMPPGGGPLDGIVTTGFDVSFVHEMGHYLGLYHTFEGFCQNNNCLIDGDRVCDTPPDNNMFGSPCNSPSNTCNTDTLSNHSNGFFFADVPDQIRNFMDFGNTGCSNMFTQGQADRMRAVILTQRNGLLQDECTPICSENIIASFTRNNPYPVPGDLISFTNTSTGGSNYQWFVDDVLISTATNFSFSFIANGKYKVTLKTYNSSIACFSSTSDFIIVTCGVGASFYTNKQTIASNALYPDSITFTNDSYNGVSYQWLISNNAGMIEQVVSTNNNLTYTFLTPATYRLRLIATNGSCSDTTNFFTVPVADPTPDGAPYYMTVTCYQQNKVRVFFCLTNYGYASIPPNTQINFYDANPLLPTAHKLSPPFFTPVSIVCVNFGYCFTHIIDVQYHGLDKIWLFFNDAGISIPVVLPNTSFVEKNYFNNTLASVPIKTIINKSICQGQSYDGYTSPGTYVDTLVSVLTGCDSIRTLNLTVRPVFATTITTSICQGQSYAGHTATGTYVDVYPAINGCDSTRTLHLTVLPVFATVITTSICQGQNYAGHTMTGTYVDVYPAINGCDSTRTLHLTVLPVFNTTITASICQGENYAGHTATGTYVDVYNAGNGCDSTRTLHLTVRPTTSTNYNIAVCQGQSYAGYNSTGTYVDVFTGVNGCDSTRTLHLIIKQHVATTINISICQGQNYAGYSAAGTYTDVLTAVNGCDSTRTLHLFVKPVFATSISLTICEGQNYAGHTAPGTYTDIYAAINGCDSTRTLQLTVNPRKYTTINTAICYGETYLAGGHLQTTTGVYRDTLRSWQGCDSVITTNLTVHPLPDPDLGIDRGICIGNTLTLDPGNFSNYLWQNGSVSPTFSTNIIGNYSVTVTNIFNCKAADTVRVTSILPLPSGFLPPDSSLCKGNILQIKAKGFIDYNWSNGSLNNFIDITQDGTYSVNVIDKYGCKGNDSITVSFYKCINIMVPNAFTPNNDGLNDTFKPLIPAPVKDYHMQIFNRWGQLVFETKDYKAGWDGTIKSGKQATAAYVYLITLIDIEGNHVKKQGTMILIR